MIDPSNLVQNSYSASRLWTQGQQLVKSYVLQKAQAQLFGNVGWLSKLYNSGSALSTRTNMVEIGYGSVQALEQKFKEAYPNSAGLYGRDVPDSKGRSDLRRAAIETIKGNEVMLQHLDSAHVQLAETKRDARAADSQGKLDQSQMAFGSVTADAALRIAELQMANNDAVARRNAFEADVEARRDSSSAATAGHLNARRDSINEVILRRSQDINKALEANRASHPFSTPNRQ